MCDLTKAAAIEREQSVIEVEIEQRLMRMEDAVINTGRKIFAQDVIEEMAELDPDRFIVALYLSMKSQDSEQSQGRGILQDLRREAISRLIRNHSGDTYALARQTIENREEVRHVA